MRFYLRLLIETAQSWGTDWILPNYENEAETISPFLVRQELDDLIAELGYKGNVGWSMQGWLPNSTNFKPISGDPVLLQIFPSDMTAIFPGNTRYDKDFVMRVCGDCVYHARERGFTYAGLTYQTYDDQPTTAYDCESYMHSTYSGNYIARADWSKWYQ